MNTVTPEPADRLAARWRSNAGADNPAGPLFTAGSFAETDITSQGRADTHVSLCTGSATVSCC
jgi:Family of unknown function (DUF6229)